MSKREVLIKILTITLGIGNIIVGLAFMLIIFMMQGFYLLLLGVLFVIFGIALFNRKYYNKLLLYGIVPITILFSLNILMSVIAKDIPEYYRTPIGIGTIIILSFWLVVSGDIFICRKNKQIKKTKANFNQTS